MSTVVVVGSQWGDEGKGKVTDALSGEAQLVVRFQGGTNAGHTVVVGDQVFKFHLIPSGVVQGVPCVIGNGVVIDPEMLVEERDRLRRDRISMDQFFISDRAHVIMPYHKVLDAAEEGDRNGDGIGTTKRGIGPTYADKIARFGIRTGDLLDRRRLKEGVQRALSRVNPMIEHVYGLEPIDGPSLVEHYLHLGEEIAPYITDTGTMVDQAVSEGKRVLLEGAQGTMLDVDHGTYPYVTSSNPTAGGACTGSGIGPTRIDKVLGVAKAYTSRVGSGPFPTELEGDLAHWIREKGGEYGTTTGRPRRIGWLDLVVLRYAVRVNGLTGLALLHLDTLAGLDEIRMATAYHSRGEVVHAFPSDPSVLAASEPVYESLPGWTDDLSTVRHYEDLPSAVLHFVERVEEFTGVPVVMVSFGPERKQTVWRQSLWD